MSENVAYPPSGPGRADRPGPSKARLLVLAALGVVVVVLVSVAVWAWPTAAGCEAQLDAALVQALQAPSLVDYTPDLTQSHYWRCYGQSDAAMNEIATRVATRHAAELLQKGAQQVLGS